MSTMPTDVEVFSGPGCMHCEAAKQLLIEHGVDFVERSIAEPKHLAELQWRLPRATSIPQVFVNGEHIGSDDDLRIRASARRPPFDR